MTKNRHKSFKNPPLITSTRLLRFVSFIGGVGKPVAINPDSFKRVPRSYREIAKAILDAPYDDSTFRLSKSGLAYGQHIIKMSAGMDVAFTEMKKLGLEGADAASRASDLSGIECKYVDFLSALESLEKGQDSPQVRKKLAAGAKVLADISKKIAPFLEEQDSSSPEDKEFNRKINKAMNEVASKFGEEPSTIEEIEESMEPLKASARKKAAQLSNIIDEFTTLHMSLPKPSRDRP
jgi:hypothetical protein